MNPQCLNEAERLDIDMVDVEDERQRYGAYTHFKIAVDFGTTYSSVAVLGSVDPQPQKRIHPEDIHVITRYPNTPEGENHPRLDVPTECWYENLKPTMKEASARNDRLLNPTHVSPSPSAASSNEIGSDKEAMADMEADLRSSSGYCWGYGVAERLDQIGIGNDRGNRLTRFKLMLDKQDSTLCVRRSLAPTLAKLIDQKQIKEESDIIAHFLESLFRHVCQELTQSYGFNKDCSVEYILCVPAAWTPKACRVMQAAMTRAIRSSEITRLPAGSIDDLFIVSEPEAATLCVMEDSRDIKVRSQAIDVTSC
jgi:hypothetical protein